MMKPVDYVNVVVLPTVREHFADKTDQRLGVLACIATCHIADYVARANRENVGCVFDELLKKCETQFKIVRGVCNGTKHGETDPCRDRQHQHRAGDEIVVPSFAWGVAGRGWGQGAWGGASLAVEHGGKRYTFGECIVAVLTAFGERYPNHFPADVLGREAVKALYPQRVLGIRSFSDVFPVQRRRRTLVWRAAKK